MLALNIVEIRKAQIMLMYLRLEKHELFFDLFPKMGCAFSALTTNCWER
jgi:hypothetical protein